MSEWIMREEKDMDGVVYYIKTGEVIRCKECKYSCLSYCGECKYCEKWDEKYDDSTKLYLDGDFYCAFAERKDNG